jgi:beta-lactamase class A
MSGDVMDINGAVHKAIDNRQGIISVLCQDLESAEPVCSINSDLRFPSASVIKIPIMVCALEEVLAGNLSLDDKFYVSAEMMLDDCINFPKPRDASLLELLTWMEINSDNTATNVLIELLGFDKINGSIGKMDLHSTALMRKMLDFASIERGRNNCTSNLDIFYLFKKLHEKSILTPELCGVALGILAKQRDNKKLARYIWEDGVRIAHKTGGLDYLCHDAGIMEFGSKSIYVGVFTDKCSEIDGYPELIGEIGRLAYDFFHEA